jgi:hypothetical protein
MRFTSAVPPLVALLVASSVIAKIHDTPPMPAALAVTPETYPKLSVDQRRAYVGGVMDADQTFFEQTKQAFAECLKDTTAAQLTDVVDRTAMGLKPYLRSTMPIAVHNAVLNNCASRGFKASY